MKTQNRLCLFLIFLTTSVKSFVIERQLKAKDDLASEFYTGIVDRATELLKEGDIEHEMDQPSEHETTFVIDSKGDARIEIKRVSNEVVIDMKNQYEEFNVASENMDYSKQKDMIDENFLMPFVKHLGEIVTDTDQAFKIIQKALPEVSVEVGESTFSVQSCSPIDGASEEAIQFDIAVDGPGMEDGIMGELVNEDQSFKLRLVTKYFQNEFILNVRTANYLAEESKNLMTKILTHMEKMIRLNEGSSGDDPSAEQSLDGEKVKASLQSVLQPLIEDEDFSNEESDNGITFSKGDDEILKIEFDTIDVGGFKFMNVKCTLPQLGDKEFSQNFLQDSLYQMTGILDAYLENVMEYTLHSVKEENPDEFVSAFETEGRRRMRILEGVLTKKTKMKRKL